MRLIYASFILLLALITTVQCQEAADDWFLKGKDLVAQGKYDEAIHAYDKAFTIDRDPVRLMNALSDWIFSFIILSLLNLGSFLFVHNISRRSLEDALLISGEENLADRSEIHRALNRFQPLNSRFWRVLLYVIPWIILELILIMIYFDQYDFILMQGSVFLVGAIDFFAARFYLRDISVVLREIWDSEMLFDRTVESSEAHPENYAPIHLEERYMSFVRNFEAYLNSRRQNALGLSFVIMFWGSTMLYDILIGSYQKIYPNISTPLYPLIFVSTNIVEIFSAFLLGIIAWRMWAISRMISELPRTFALIPKLDHPDNCGGFSPLGNICLWSAFLVGIWAILLGVWIAPFSTKQFTSIYVQLHEIMLVMITVISLLFFIKPLWNVHKVMLISRAKVRHRLWEIGGAIDQLESDLLFRADSLEPDQSEKITKKLEILRTAYKEHETYPVWPFNTLILKKLALIEVSPMVIPIMSALGLPKTIIDIAKNAVDLFTQFGKS
jgi:hypothetical protein